MQDAPLATAVNEPAGVSAETSSPPAFEITAPLSVNEPVAWIRQQVDCQHIDAKCVTRRCGERCDRDLAVAQLFVDTIPLQYASLMSSAKPADARW